MVDLRTQYADIKTDVDRAIQEVLDTTAFIKGPAVSHFEEALSAYLGAPFVVGVGNGTDALQIAYMAAGVRPGDEIITTTFSFIATAEAAVVLGARPVFVDIDPATFNIDVEQVADRITERTRAIVPVHLFGQPAEMDPLLHLGAEHGIPVIEDNAQAIGSTYRGRKTGSMGSAGCFSFFPSKNLGCFGDGGAVSTSDPTLAERIRMIANHGARKKYYNEVPGLNSRLDTIQAAVLGVKLAHLEHYNDRRRLAADRYDSLLADVEGVITPPRTAESRHVFHQYTVRIRIEGIPLARDRVAATLKEMGIPHAVYYPVCLHHLPVMSEVVSEPFPLPQAEQAAREVLSLPMHTELDSSQQERVAESIQRAVARATENHTAP